MAIKKAKANYYHSDTEYTTYHYETQAKQVKILGSDGSIESDIQEMLLNGKLIEAQSANTLVNTGLYQLKNCTDVPVEMTLDKEYLLTVEATGKLVKQTFFDSENNSLYIRPIYEAIAGEWIPVGKITSDAIVDIVASIGDIASLETKVKDSVVGALNGLQTEVTANTTGLATAKEDITSLETQLTSHNHNGVYLSVNGGDLKGNTSITNNTSFQGKNTSGVSVNIGKVDANNKVTLGDTTTETVIQAVNGELKLFDGTNLRSVFHEGNMGQGSGLNADMVDGIEGSDIARLDVANYLNGEQVIQEGKNLTLKAPAGSSQAGAIYFKDGANAEKGRIIVGVNGDMSFFAGGNNHHTVKASGEMFSTHHHVFDCTSRDVAVKWRKDKADAGMGWHFWAQGEKLSLHDYKNDRSLMTTDRSEGIIQFYKHITIQGYRVYIQPTAPTVAKAGDIWFDI